MLCLHWLRWFVDALHYATRKGVVGSLNATRGDPLSTPKAPRDDDDMCLPTRKPRNARKPRAALATRNARNARVTKQPRRALVTSRAGVVKPLPPKRAPLQPVSMQCVELRTMADTHRPTASCSHSTHRSEESSDDMMEELRCEEPMRWCEDEAVPIDARRWEELRCDDDISRTLDELNTEAAVYWLERTGQSFDSYRQRLDREYVLSKARLLEVRTALAWREITTLQTLTTLRSQLTGSRGDRRTRRWRVWRSG
jgi:hypothetical protein